jgi:oxepin-CoA hydrolase/3-oxo-5,6-dehydrosuberyl-CoA semialdehyde dehydrogenase
VTEADIVNFAGISGDYFYAHMDDIAAKESLFERRVAHGYFVLSAAAGLFVDPAPGPVLANYGLESLRFTKPVYVGDTITAGPRTVTLDDIEHFAEFTGDTFYAHMDEEAAKANPFFGGRVAHGYLVVSFAAGLFVSPEPGPVLANYGLENLRFLAPTFPGDELTVQLTAKQITPRENAGYGEVRWDTVVTRQDGAVVAQYDVLTLVAKQEAT